MFDSGDVPAVADVTIQSTTQASPPVHSISDILGHYVIPSIASSTYSLQTQSQFQSATWVGAAKATVIDQQITRVDIALHRSTGVATPTPARLPTTGGMPLPLPLTVVVGAAALVIGLSLRLRFL